MKHKIELISFVRKKELSRKNSFMAHHKNCPLSPPPLSASFSASSFLHVHVNQNLTAFFVSFVDFPASGRFQYIHVRQIYEIECLNYDKDNSGFFLELVLNYA